MQNIANPGQFYLSLPPVSSVLKGLWGSIESHYKIKLSVKPSNIRYLEVLKQTGQHCLVCQVFSLQFILKKNMYYVFETEVLWKIYRLLRGLTVIVVSILNQVQFSLVPFHSVQSSFYALLEEISGRQKCFMSENWNCRKW